MNTPTHNPLEQKTESTQQTPRTWIIWCVVFCVAFILYACTASRGIQWQDRGQNVLRIITGEYVNPLGLALSHPLYYWFGRVFVSAIPAEPAFSVTLVSAVFGGLAVANLFGCVNCATRDVRSALFAAGSLGVAHIFWQMSTVAEMYTITAALLAGELWCVAVLARGYQRRILYLLFFLNGLGLANHLFAVLMIPVWGGLTYFFVRRGEARKLDCVGVGLLWLVGASLYVVMFISEAARTGDFSATVHSALFGNYYADEVLNLSFNWRMTSTTLAFYALSFPSLVIPFAIRGAFVRKAGANSLGFRSFLLAPLAIHFWFVIRYHVADQHTFLVPVIVLTSVLAGLGFSAMRENRARWSKPLSILAVVLLVLTPALYAVVPDVARRADVLRNRAHHKPYRDDYVYLFAPWSVVERSADRMSREAVRLAAPDGIVIAEDRMGMFAVQYQVHQQKLANVEVLYEPSEDVFDSAANQARTVVLVPLHRDQPRAWLPSGSWERVGDLYVWRE